MEFEWDENKKNQNFAKHGVDFSIANEFFNGKIFRKIDNRKNYSEERLIAFGEVSGRILTVVYTIRNRNTYRIISIRRARKDEQRTYRTLQERHERHN
jgi:uncharacterized DUF497 family protein